MSTLNIVLVEPRIPQNVGNIGRTCAATGTRLHLIEPLGFEITDKKLKRAGMDYWKYLDVSYYSNLEDFFMKNPQAVCRYFTTKAETCYSDATYPDNSFLFFGREDAGLPETLLIKNKLDCVRVPMKNGLRSLNLANTVAIATYETLRQWNFPDLVNKGQLHEYNWEDIEID